jgi:hypothetical protein
MTEDIIFRLSPGGGPPPEAELLFHAQRAREYGYTWVGLRRSMNAARIECGRSRLYLITSAAEPKKTVLRGIVREASNRRPDDDLLRDFYRDHDLPAWWRIDHVESMTVDFDALGLRMTDGRPYDTSWLSLRQPVNYLQPRPDWPAQAADAADAGVLREERPIRAEDVRIAEEFEIVAPPLTRADPAVTGLEPPSGQSPLDVPALHAVDWSGGGSFAAPNAKIRYARWDLRTGRVTVMPATLSRKLILEMIRTRPGLWMLDFPFGLPAELLRTAGSRVNDIDATLAFTRGVEKGDFRDHCNAVWGRTRGRSKHRATERAVGCGWFTWFIQLFRQTWTGQVEILSALREQSDVAILPWDHGRSAVTWVVEGFPSSSLLRRGLPATGYKHPSDAGRKARAAIINGLVSLGLPLNSDVQEEALNDSEGDLIDALVMLLAGRDALSADHKALYNELNRRGLLGEGVVYR